jgi:hypothetical protein
MLLPLGGLADDVTGPAALPTTAAPSVDAPPQHAAFPPHVKRVDFRAPVNFALVHDIDDNGLPELVLTSHGGNFTQVFQQTAPRQFRAMPPIRSVGFHPNDFSALRHPPGLYVANAEGEGELRLFRFDAELRPWPVSAVKTPLPVYTTPFAWPRFGDGIAVSTRSGVDMNLLFDFDPEQHTWQTRKLVKLGRGTRGMTAKPVITDLNGDGVVEIVVVDHRSRSLLSVREPEENTTAVSEQIWSFQSDFRPLFVLSADINADRRPDLLVGGLPATHLAALINQGAGRLEETRLPGSPPEALAGDLARDRDGALYVLLAGGSDFTLMQLAPDSAEVIWQASASNGGTWVSAQVLLRDLDADGWLDAIVIRDSHGFNNAVVFGPLKRHFSDLSLAATEEFFLHFLERTNAEN